MQLGIVPSVLDGIQSENAGMLRCCQQYSILNVDISTQDNERGITPLLNRELTW